MKLVEAGCKEGGKKEKGDKKVKVPSPRVPVCQCANTRDEGKKGCQGATSFWATAGTCRVTTGG